MLPAFGGIRYVIEFLQQEPVNKDICKIVELLPGAREMIKPASIREKGPVKSTTGHHPQGKKQEITGRDDPGKPGENPGTQHL